MNMSNTPDFVLQIQEVERNLNAKWQTVQESWRDQVAESYKTGVMEPYAKNFNQYISGEGISGYGVAELLQQMNKHLQEMSSLTGYTEEVM